MSIILEGIDMPKIGDCHHITIYDNGNTYVTTSNVLYETDRKDIKAVQIPAPHGRLIDGDELADIVDGTDWYHINRKGELVHGAGVEDEALYKADDILTTVNNFPTIIDAER